jgi:hypothetical protein
LSCQLYRRFLLGLKEKRVSGVVRERRVVILPKERDKDSDFSRRKEREGTALGKDEQ